MNRMFSIALGVLLAALCALLVATLALPTVRAYQAVLERDACQPGGADGD